MEFIPDLVKEFALMVYLLTKRPSKSNSTKWVTKSNKRTSHTI